LEKIKGFKSNNMDNETKAEDIFININEEFNALIKELNKEAKKPINVIFRILEYKFLEGRYKYYRLYINGIPEFENYDLLNKENKDNDEEKKMYENSEDTISSKGKYVKIEKNKTNKKRNTLFKSINRKSDYEPIEIPEMEKKILKMMIICKKLMNILPSQI
jgi:hypothetical protein